MLPPLFATVLALVAACACVDGRVIFSPDFMPLSLPENTRGVLLVEIPSATDDQGGTLTYSLDSGPQSSNVRDGDRWCLLA